MNKVEAIFFWIFPIFYFFLFLMGTCFDDRLLWRERDWLELCTALAANDRAHQQLVQWGLLKFVENDLLQSQDRLLRYLIQHWNEQCKVFMLRGCDVAICPETDIYFLTRLLPQGEVLRYPLPSGRVDFE